MNRVTQALYTDQRIFYSYDQGPNGMGRLTGASDANHTLSWSYDALGRVTGKAQTVGSRRWDPDTYGSVPPTASGLTYNLRFPGQYALAETGLYYNMARDYDPAMGRYLESDPIGLQGGINTYAYVRSNPISRADPQGLLSLQISDEWRNVDIVEEHPDAPGFTNWRAGASCKCTCGSPSKLLGCNGHVYIDVQIKNTSWNAKYNWVRHGESQHAIDLADASGSYRKAGQAMEDDIKAGGGFPSQEECERRSALAVRDALAAAVNLAYQGTIQNWDAPNGPHTFWPWSPLMNSY